MRIKIFAILFLLSKLKSFLALVFVICSAENHATDECLLYAQPFYRNVRRMSENPGLKLQTNHSSIDVDGEGTERFCG